MVKVVNVLSELRKDNPSEQIITLKVYGDALTTYLEAAANIATNGAVCFHPRTGAPIENPYLKIRTVTGVILGKMRYIKSDQVLKLLGK